MILDKNKHEVKDMSMRTPIVTVALILQLFLNSCGVSFVVQEKKKRLSVDDLEPIKETSFWRNDYLFEWKYAEEKVFLKPIAYRIDLEFSGNRKRERWLTERQMKKEDGGYITRFHMFFHSSEDFVPRKPYEIILTNLILAIPSLGISIIIATVDGLTLPLRLLDSEKEYSFPTYQYQRPIRTRLPEIAGDVECGSFKTKVNNGVATIPLEEFFRANRSWHTIYVCKLHDRHSGEQRNFELRLVSFLGKSRLVAEEGVGNRQGIVDEMLEMVKNARRNLKSSYRLHPLGDAFFFTVMNDNIAFLPAGRFRNRLETMLASPNLRHRSDWGWSFKMQETQDHILRDAESLLVEVDPGDL